MRVRVGDVDISFYRSNPDREHVAHTFNGKLARFGFCWFRLMPYFHSNGGKLSKRQVKDMTAQWLCFGIGLTIWGNQ